MRVLAFLMLAAALGISWFERAAESGDVESQSNLCVAYEMALFVPQDYERSAKWCRARARAQQWVSGRQPR